MRLRFWEPFAEPSPDHRPVAMAGMPLPPEPLTPRRMNLTDLEKFAKEMAQAVSTDGTYVIRTNWAGAPQPGREYTWDELEGLHPEDRARIAVVAEGPPPGVDVGAARDTYQPQLASLMLGDGMSHPATLQVLNGSHDRLLILVRRWNELGERRPTWALLFPMLFLAGVLVALAPLLVMWWRGDLSRWFVLPTAGLLWLTFATGAPMLQRLVARHRSSRASLAIDYRFLARLRLDKAANRRNLMSGLVGAGLGAFIAVLGVWATLKAG